MAAGSGPGGTAGNPRRLCCSAVTEAAGSPAPAAQPVSPRREPEALLGLDPSARLNGRARRALIGPRGFEWGAFHLTEQTRATGCEAPAPQLHGQPRRSSRKPAGQAATPGLLAPGPLLGCPLGHAGPARPVPPGQRLARFVPCF